MRLIETFKRLLAEVGVLQKLVQRQTVLVNNIFREGTVKSVDFQKGTVVVEAHGIKTKPIPWTEQAGDIVEWNPPSAGQRVVVVSPSGNLGRAFMLHGGFTDAVPQPHDRGAEKRTKIGQCVITQTGEHMRFDIGGARLTFSSTGLSVEVGGTSFAFTADGFAQTGGNQTHDGHIVDRTHVHTQVFPGGGLSGPPP